jgi:lysine 2,3-aminomutase
LSGGDPLTVRPEMLMKVLSRLGDLQRSGKLDIVRIGTRLPIHNPRAFTEKHYEAIKQLEIPHMMIHVNHPDELTPETLEVWRRLRTECNAIIRTQTVLLKGVNDDPETLYQLFYKIAKNGGVPYYMYQNDPVYWAGHFTVPIREAIQLWQTLRAKGQSGLATTVKFVIDSPGANGKAGFGKIVVPEGGAWKVDYEKGYLDVKGQRFRLDDLDTFADPEKTTSFEVMLFLKTLLQKFGFPLK